MEDLESKRKIMNIDGSTRLPSNVVKVIFSKLAISNLPACRLVCKIWNDFVIDYASSCKFVPNTFFVSTHNIITPSDCICNCNSRCRISREFNHKIRHIDIDTMNYVASFGFEGDDDYSSISIASSCNGLLLISKTIGDILCEGILNPMTNEFFELPQPEECEEDGPIYGFGFSLKTRQYKVFRITCQDNEEFHCIMEIMRFGDRSGTKEWIPFERPPIMFAHHGAYLNGVIYWMGQEKGKEYVVYALNVETEQIESSVVLEVGPYTSKNYGFVGTFNSSVYACIAISESCCRRVQVWMMQENNSWTREFVMYDIPKNLYMSVHLIKVLKDGERWFIIDGNIFCCDKTGTNNKIIKSLNNNETGFEGLCQIQSLNFGSLQNILAGYQ